MRYNTNWNRTVIPEGTQKRYRAVGGDRKPLDNRTGSVNREQAETHRRAMEEYDRRMERLEAEEFPF